MKNAFLIFITVLLCRLSYFSIRRIEKQRIRIIVIIQSRNDIYEGFCVKKRKGVCEKFMILLVRINKTEMGKLCFVNCGFFCICNNTTVLSNFFSVYI